jgi:signal transduction histidine kinase
MDHRNFSALCLAFMVAISPLQAGSGPSTDSLLRVLNSNKIRNNADKYKLLCEIASSTDDPDIKLRYSEQAIKLARKLNIIPAEPTVFKGESYLNSGKLDSALACFLQAANYYKTAHHNKGLATAYLYVSEAYNQQENHANAKYYLKNAIDLYSKEKDSLSLAYALHNLGYAYYRMGQYDSALILFSKTGEIYQKLNSLYEYAYCLGNSGLVYSKQSDLQKAEDCLLHAIEILTRQGDERAPTEYMIEYANVLQRKGEIKKALTYASLSFRNAEKYGIKEYKRDAAYRLAQLYHVSGRYDSAFYYQALYIAVNDSIKSTESIQKMADLRTEFEVAKKQAEVDGLQKRKLIQLIVILALTVILLLAVGIIVLYYYSLKRSQKLTAALDERRILLEKQSAELEDQKALLLQQKEELQTTLENLRKTQEQLIESEKMAAIGGLVTGVAHEINTPIGIGITAISSLQDDIQRIAGMYEKEEISREDFKEFIKTSEDVSKLIQKNLERTASLVQSFKQLSTDQVTEQKRVFAFKDYLNDILVSLRPKFREKKIDFKIECDEDLQLNSYPGVYAQIITNLLINSLDHGFHKKSTGTIRIKAESNKKMIRIGYSDDGVGISEKDLPHIFEPFYTTDQQRGTGLGLNITYNLVRQKLQGTITCESRPGEGVLFVMEIPVQ